jgi:hypothetical protein
MIEVPRFRRVRRKVVAREPAESKGDLDRQFERPVDPSPFPESGMADNRPFPEGDAFAPASAVEEAPDPGPIETRDALEARLGPKEARV